MFPTPPSSSPPPSPSKRRRRLRESEETEGEITIETFLYRSDGFRSSSFLTPLPLPLKLEAPIADLQLDGSMFGPLCLEILSILEDHSIHEEKTHLAMRMVSKPGYSVGTPVLTLIVEITQGLEIPTSAWSQVRDQLQDLLNTNGFEHVRVEMYDWDRAFMPSIFPLMPNHEAIPIYEHRRAGLLDCVRKELGKSWTMMSLFGFGLKHSTSKPALVIFVNRGVIQDWKKLENKLRAILPNPNITIEFLPANVSETPGMSLAQSLTADPTMGSSIGEVGEHGGGTLGGHIVFNKNGTSHQGILTNHHVVKPTSASKEDMDLINRHGFGNSGVDFTISCQYPAHDDLKATLEHFESEIPGIVEDIHQLQMTLDRFEMKGEPAPQRQLGRMETYRYLLRKAQERKTVADNLPITIGKVLHSSGEAVSAKGSILDWAIVENQNAQASQYHPNKLPESNSDGLVGKLADFYGTGEPNYTVDTPRYARSFGDIEKGKLYFKIGRTTKLTTGICNGTEAEVQRQGQIRWDEDGNQSVPGKESTSELVIMGMSNDGSEKNLETFSRPGDSGSFVINTFGEVCGLMYGELTGYVGPNNRARLYINAGLVTSMDEVLQSIKAKTRGYLSLH